MTNEKNSKIVYSNQKKISIYSSEIIKRGLDLAQKIYPYIVEKSNQLQSHKWKHICNITHPRNKITSVALSSDEKRIVAIDAWGNINIWDLPSGRLLHQPFLGHQVEAITYRSSFKDLDEILQQVYEDFIENGRNFDIFITQDSKKIIRYGTRKIDIIDLNKMSVLNTIFDSNDICFNFNMHILIYTDQYGKIIIFDVKKDRKILELDTGFTFISYAVISKNAQFLVVSGAVLIGGELGEGDEIYEHSIKIWNLCKFEAVQVNKFIDSDNARESSHIFISADGTVVVSIDDEVDETLNDSDSYIINTWDSISGHKLNDLRLDDNYISLASTGKLIYKSNEYSKKVEIRDLKTGELIQTIDNNWFIDTLTTSLDGKMLACVYSDINFEKINIWNTENGKLMYEINSLELFHKSNYSESHIKSLRFSEDEKKLISIHIDGSANIWKLINNQDDSDSLNSFEFQIV